jgi:hypothetical protein
MALVRHKKQICHNGLPGHRSPSGSRIPNPKIRAAPALRLEHRLDAAHPGEGPAAASVDTAASLSSIEGLHRWAKVEMISIVRHFTNHGLLEGRSTVAPDPHSTAALDVDAAQYSRTYGVTSERPGLNSSSSYY